MIIQITSIIITPIKKLFPTLWTIAQILTHSIMAKIARHLVPRNVSNKHKIQSKKN